MQARGGDSSRGIISGDCMKGLFNGTCAECEKLKPRCARVYLKHAPTEVSVMCSVCRGKFRGLFRMHNDHHSPSSLPPRESESKFTFKVIELAKVYGWRSIHIRPGMVQSGSWRTPYQGDGKGFPDLLLLRKGETIAAELKADPKNQPTYEQVEWLRAFYLAGAQVFVWRPEDWKEIESVISGEKKQSRDEAKTVLMKESA